MIRVTGIRRKDFQQRLVSACGGCATQHTGWPCGTCFFGSFDSQRFWHAVLVYRGDSEDFRTTHGYRMPNGIHFKDDGTFSHHTYVEYSLPTIKAYVLKLWELLK